MKDSLSSQETLSYNPLIRYFSLLWQQTGTIYSFLLLGIALMLGAIWTITGSQALQISNLFPFIYPLADFLFGASLLVITAIAWGVSRIHSNPSTIAHLHNADIQRNRRALINLLLLDYERRLTQSLQGVALDRLQLRDRSDIQPPDSPLILYPSEQEMGYFLPAGTSILEAYEQVGSRFLLVGNSGHGKTTHLLNLARELLIRAQNDQEQPIPIVIKMASWATRDKPFSNWIDEQLLKYQLDSTRNQIMLTNTRWILLFDDFDEVDASEHAECIRAINAFRDRYMNAPIVVCSTGEALLSQAEVFNISSAIEILPLQVQDILNYLTQIGEPAAAIAETFQANGAYQQLLSSPFMLDIALLTYQDKPIQSIPQSSSPEELQGLIIDDYVSNILEQQPSPTKYTPQQFRQWLGWLAQRMNLEPLSEFHLEDLQPDWLSTKRGHFLYNVLTWGVPGLALWIIFGVILTLIAGYPYGLWEALFTLVLIELLALKPWDQAISLKKTQVWSWNYRWHALLTGLLICLLSGLIFGINGGQHLGLTLGMVYGLIFGIIGLVSGNKIDSKEWDLSSEQINEERSLAPNKGIQNVGWNALKSMLFYGLTMGLFFSLMLGFPIGLFIILAYSLLFSLAPNGRNYLFHYALRFTFFLNENLPWNYVLFLEEACNQHLLQRVGSGYSFAHPQLQSYFAAQGGNGK